MRLVKQVAYLEPEERSSSFSTGLLFTLEDGTTVEQMTTDVVADRLTNPTPNEQTT